VKVYARAVSTYVEGYVYGLSVGQKNRLTVPAEMLHSDGHGSTVVEITVRVEYVVIVAGTVAVLVSVVYVVIVAGTVAVRVSVAYRDFVMVAESVSVPVVETVKWRVVVVYLVMQVEKILVSVLQTV